MIAKRIDRDKEKVKYDNFRALALYVVGHTEKNPEEKVLHSWLAGCGADNFYEALIEAECVQSLNTGSQKDKTYHLMLSFRPEDESGLTPERMEAVEKKIAAALGFEGHQRVCGIHKNTGHIHMHIAYNKINPEKFTIKEPYRDFFTLAKVCREIEQEYGLVVDPGLEPGRTPTRPNIKAQTVEAHTGEQSFDSYMQERRDALLAGLEQCRSWKDLYELLGSIGVVIVPKGAGCVFKDKHGKHAVKGSSVAREFSLSQLEKRFGRFSGEEKKMEDEKKREEEQYTAKPLRGAERDELYLEYRRGIDERKAVLETLSGERERLTREIREEWRGKRARIKDMLIIQAHKYELMTQWKVREEEDVIALRSGIEKKRAELRERVPYTNWTNFLQYKAHQGNEPALEILREKKVDTAWKEPEVAGRPQRDTLFWKKRIAEIAGDTGLIHKDKRTLIGVAQMMDLQAEGLAGTEGLTHSIDIQGVILFKLKSGGQVRDDGKNISYSAFDPAAEKIAAKYAAARFGKFRRDGTVLTREPKLDYLRTF
jgi:hypothetical protein